MLKKEGASQWKMSLTKRFQWEILSCRLVLQLIKWGLMPFNYLIFQPRGTCCEWNSLCVPFLSYTMKFVRDTSMIIHYSFLFLFWWSLISSYIGHNFCCNFYLLFGRILQIRKFLFALILSFVETNIVKELS